MVWRMILWLLVGLAGLITLVLILPVGIRVRYQQGILKLWYTIGPIRLLRYPETEKEREKRKNSKINLRTVLDEPIKANRKYDNVLGDFWAELKTTLGLFWCLRPRLRIKRLWAVCCLCWKKRLFSKNVSWMWIVTFPEAAPPWRPNWTLPLVWADCSGVWSGTVWIHLKIQI